MNRLPAILILLMSFAAQSQEWTLTSAPSTNWGAFACSADGIRVLAGAGGGPEFTSPPGPVYVSTNSGLTWNRGDGPVGNWVGLALSADGFKVAGAINTPHYPRPPISQSSDGGSTWFGSGSPQTNHWLSLNSSADGSVLVASDRGGGFVPGAVLLSTDGGTTWGWSLHENDNWPWVAGSADCKTIVAAQEYRGGLYRSTDAGMSWSVTNFPAYKIIIALSANGSHLIAASIGGGIFISKDLGDTWESTSAPDLDWRFLKCSADGRTIVAAVNNTNPYDGSTTPGPLYFSTNSGSIWTLANIPERTWVSVALSADGNRLYAASSEGSIYTRQTTPRPVLNLTSSGGNVHVSLLKPSTSFTLQQNTNLNTSDWKDVAVSPVLNLTNLQNEITIPAPGSRAFYRLRSE